MIMHRVGDHFGMVWGLMAVCGDLPVMRAVMRYSILGAGCGVKWKPPDDRGTHPG